MSPTKASLKHRTKGFLLGFSALLLGVLGAYLVLTTRLSLRPGVSDVPPGIRLLLPAAILMILGALVMMTRSIRPINHELRLCPFCGTTTKQFRADPRFRKGKEIGYSYICETCGHKHLTSNNTSIHTDERSASTAS